MKKKKPQISTARRPGIPSVTAAAQKLGISRQALYARLRGGMDEKLAFSLGPLATNPNPSQSRLAEAEGRETITKICLAAGVPESTYYARRKQGLSEKECLQRPIEEGVNVLDLFGDSEA